MGYQEQLDSQVNPPLTEMDVLNGKSLDQPGDNQDIQDNTPVGDIVEQTKKYLLNIFNRIQQNESTSREQLVRELKYYSLLYQGLQPFWNTQISNWDSIDKFAGSRLPDGTIIDANITSKVINIIRPYGEAIASAMASGTPKVNYYPEDADRPEDIKTAKVYTAIEKRIASYNTVDLKLLKAILTWWKYGLVAAHVYNHTDYCYGNYKVPQTKEVEVNTYQNTCPECGSPMGEEYDEEKELSKQVALTDSEILEEDISKDNEEENLEPSPGTNPQMGMSQQICPTCQSQVQPQQNLTGRINQEVPNGEEERPKTRQIFDIYSALEVKIPSRATSQEDIIWCILEDEKHYSLLRSIYLEYYDNIKGGEADAESSYERWARANYEISSETLEDYSTNRIVWLRPTSYAMEGKDVYDFLIKQFPDGVCFTVLAGLVVDFKSEKLDDSWVFGFNPSDNRLILRPGCSLIVPIQELTNEVMSLEVKNLRFSVPTVVADSEFFNFQAYKRMQGQPGVIYPGTMPPSGNMQSIFGEVKTATLPREITELDAKLEKFAQFCSGGMPSVFGGDEGSSTATEYVQKKNQALQRLGIPWKMVNHLYAGIMARAIKLFRSSLKQDDHFVQKQGISFVNIYIRKGDLEGNVGDILPEVSEQFPTTWAEKAGRFMELLNLKDPVINQALFHPENLSLAVRLIGLPEFYIPGDDERNKELTAISKTLRIEQDPMTGQMIPPFIPPVDPNIDNPQIHVEVIKAFLNSDLGIEIQENKPESYQLILQRLEQYNMDIAQKEMQAQMQGQDPNNPQNQGQENG